MCPPFPAGLMLGSLFFVSSRTSYGGINERLHLENGIEITLEIRSLLRLWSQPQGVMDSDAWNVGVALPGGALPHTETQVGWNRCS